MTALAPAPAQPERNLPKGLWIGTAIFAVLSAGALYLGITLERQSFEKSPEKRVEGTPFHSPRAEAEKAPESAPGGPEPGAVVDKKAAVKHYDQGIAAFMRGDYRKAHEEWKLCQQLDAANSDCAAGLQRINAAYGK